MKKLIAFALVLVMVMALAVGCSKKPADKTPTTNAPETTNTPGTSVPDTTGSNMPTTVMTYAEYAAIEVVEGGEQVPVLVECYIAAVETWYNGACHIYALCEEGGYYIYGYACTQEEAAALTVGQKIRVAGYKTVWSGEIEIVDATIEKLEGTAPEFTADDVTALIGKDELTAKMNDLVVFKGLTVAASKDANGNETAFLYKWDGSGKQGDDLYFNVTDGTNTYTFTINAYLIGTGKDSEVYKAVEALEVGDKINVEGFLYWYNGAQTHVTNITNILSYADYAAIEVVEGGDQIPVVVECTVATIEAWYNNNCQIYALCEDGGYYIYNYACTKEEAEALVPGTKIRVSGYKTVWAGEFEIVDATLEVIGTDNTAYTPDDVTGLTGADLEAKMNDLVAFKNLTVAASTDANGNEAAFLYKWDGSGKQGDDLYFNVTDGTNTYTFTVNVYMVGTGVESGVYKAVEGLEIGNKIDLVGFLYWYKGAQTHVTELVVNG